MGLEVEGSQRISIVHKVTGVRYCGERFGPDWGIQLSADSGKSKEIMVAGESKCSTKWTSDRESGISITNWEWPFRQILTYCIAGETRYGFLHTPVELVAVRVCTDDGSTYKLEYQAIPSQNHGEEKLTAHLSLWALSMFALNSGHRPISTKEQTLPLNVWWKDDRKDGTSVFEHHLTGRKVDEQPEGAECRSRPTERLDTTRATSRRSTRKK